MLSKPSFISISKRHSFAWWGGRRVRQKIAIAIVHGMGQQKGDFAAQMQAMLEQSIKKQLRHRRMDKEEMPFVCVPIHWAPVTDQLQSEMAERLNIEHLPWASLRQYVVSYLGDAIAYQVPPLRNQFVLDTIHQRLAKGLSELSKLAGNEAPLCIISHSLGTVICNEFFKTLQRKAHSSAAPATPLERGFTLALYYTMGSPIPIWALREQDYGEPVTIPSHQWSERYTDVPGEWINFYSPYDVLGYPLKPINAAYDQMVRQDLKVKSGTWFTRYTPLAHSGYWTHPAIVETIAKQLVQLYRQVNQLQ